MNSDREFMFFSFRCKSFTQTFCGLKYYWETDQVNNRATFIDGTFAEV